MPTAKQMIEQRLAEMGEYEGIEEYHYVCGDTGMDFCTYGQEAAFSPFTGTPDITSATSNEVDDDVVDDMDLSYDDPYYEEAGMPANAANPSQQVPQKPAPAPSQSGQFPMGPQSSKQGSKPKDDKSRIGSNAAGPKGYVGGYPQSGAVPSYKSATSGQRTD